MTTASDIISEAAAELHGWGTTQDRVAVLTSNMDLLDSTFTVQSTFGQSVGISTGPVEIDDEIVYITAAHPDTGICEIADGFGRGYNNTVATQHLAGARVVSRPKFPRTWLFKTLNEVIQSVFPKIYAVNTFSTVVAYPGNSYTLPNRPVSILDIQYQDVIGRWQPVQVYTFDTFDGSLRVIADGTIPGRPLRIVYATRPKIFTAVTDDLATTGLPESCKDLLVMGVVARVIPGLDISRAQNTSVEQSDRSRVVPPNAGLTASQYLIKMYMDRVENEGRALRQQFRVRLRRVF